MSSNTSKSKRDSRERNKKRLHKNAIETLRRDELELAELLVDIGRMLSAAQGYSETLGAVLRVYIPEMTQEENQACTSPWSVMVTDLKNLMLQYDELVVAVNSAKGASLNPEDFEDAQDTILGLGYFNRADNIMSEYNMAITPLLLDTYSQVGYIVDKYGADKMSGVDGYLKGQYDHAKAEVKLTKENHSE